MAAALATTDILQRDAVVDTIYTTGRHLQQGWQGIIDETGLPVTQSPYPSMPFLYFDPKLADDQESRRDRFYGALSELGVFAHPRHHGFLSWRHGEKEIDHLLEATRCAAKIALG